MRPTGLAASLLFLLAATPAALAQPLFTGEPFPLTHTQYRQPWGYSQLITASGSPFLFWNENGTLRAERVGQSTRVGRAILNDVVRDGFSVAWTGSHFLVVAETTDGTPGKLISRVVDADGVARRDPVTLFTSRLAGAKARIAFNGTHALVLYEAFDKLLIHMHSLLLDADGNAVSAPRILDEPLEGNVSVAAMGTSFIALIGANYNIQAFVVTFDSEGRIVTQNEAGPERATETAIACNGQQCLVLSAVRQTASTAVLAEPVDASGHLGAGIVLEVGTDWFFDPAITWSGSEWIASYWRIKDGHEKVRIVHLDATARRVMQREETNGAMPSLAAIDGRTLAAFRTETGSLAVSALPLETGERSPSSAAAPQTLLATASSENALLVIWSEGAMRAGILQRDGTWIERQIAPAYTRVVAGSDGREFVVVLQKEAWYWGQSSPSALRLDTDLRQIGDPIPVRQFPSAIARIGAWVGVGENATIEPLFSFFGPTWVPTLQRAPLVQHPSIAAGTDGFYVVWSEAYPAVVRCGAESCTFTDSVALVGAHVSADLRRIEKPAVLAEGRTYRPAVVWSGREYVVVWNDERGAAVARVGRDVGSMPAISRLAGDPAQSHVLATGNTAVMFWRTRDSELVDRVMPVNEIGIGPALEVGRDLHMNAPALLATLPDGQLAVVYSAAENDAPYHGAYRLMMRVVAPAPLPSRPGPPRASGGIAGREAVLFWSAPDEEVHGYRVEIHDGDGIWREVARVDPHAPREIRVPAPENRVIALRVRAWNLAGPGPYSEPVLLNPQRRRAAR